MAKQWFQLHRMEGVCVSPDLGRVQRAESMIYTSSNYQDTGPSFSYGSRRVIGEQKRKFHRDPCTEKNCLFMTNIVVNGVADGRLDLNWTDSAFSPPDLIRAKLPTRRAAA
jgi:hypothetical protein